MKKRKKIVVVGGGTGTFTVLSGLKKYPVNLSVIVSMADDGGSSGLLRDELGVLPPGDIRQCLVALSTSDRLMRELMNYRFVRGKLKGHSVGNLLLSALEKVTGSFDAAVAKTSEILRIRGQVIPATLDNVRLVAFLKNGGVIRGQHPIDIRGIANLKRLILKPSARPNPKALAALKDADAIVIGPGDLYSSIIPDLLVSDIARAIAASRAKKIYVCNLMNKARHTDGFTVIDYVREIESYLHGKVDYVIYNRKRPSALLLRRYGREGERFVEYPKGLPKSQYFGGDLISRAVPHARKGDALRRTFIRHNPDRLAKLILKLL